MVIDFTLLGNPFYVDQPHEIIGWVGWLILLSLLILLAIRWRKLNKHWTRLQGGFFVGLLVLLFLTNLFVVVRLPEIKSILPPAQAQKLAGMVLPV